jgi:puromycin-sensitive aminopeptidase
MKWLLGNSPVPEAVDLVLTKIATADSIGEDDFVPTLLPTNEGVASFMENLTTDILYPEYSIWEQFVPGTLIMALQLDALNSSHPIEVDVGHPSEVDEIFESISYNKGASVIRMLYDWIGEAAFKTGMHIYLTKYSYGNTETGVRK